MNKKIYLQSGNINIKRTPIELLEEAAEKIQANGDTMLSYFSLQPPSSSDANPYIDMELLPLDESDRETHRDAVRLMHDKSYTDPALFNQKTVTKESVHLLEVWNSMLSSDIDQVSDIPSLLRRTRDELVALGEVEVIDIIMHDYIDDDALLRPYVRVYYK